MEFFYRYKKIFLIIGFLAVVGIMGFLLYTLFFKPSPPVTPGTENTNSSSTGKLPSSDTGSGQITTPGKNGQLPGEEDDNQEEQSPKQQPLANQGTIETTSLTKSPSLAPTLTNDGNDIMYYDKQQEKFFKVGNDGEITPLSDKIFHSVENVTWSPTKDKAILEFPDGANVVYNFSSQKQVTLPKHWKDFDWSPDGNSIVLKSMGLDPDNRWLGVTNDDGSRFYPIEALGDKDDTVYPAWSPNKQVVAMFTEGIDFDRQNVYFVGLNEENFKSAVIEGRGFEPKWSPDGKQLLYSVYSSNSDMKPGLWLVNAQGESIGSGRRDLNIATWASKCTYADEKNLYCAVPEQLEEGAGLFPEMAETTKDDLYKVDLTTGLKKLVATPDGDYSMTNLVVPENGNYLYFTDAKSGRIYKINIE